MLWTRAGSLHSLTFKIQWEGITMNTTELVDTLAAGHGLTRADARKLIHTVLEAIVEAGARGEEIALSGFGKFRVRHSPARQVRNPATGEPIHIAASRKLTFAGAKAVRDRLNR